MFEISSVFVKTKAKTIGHRKTTVNKPTAKHIFIKINGVSLFSAYFFNIVRNKRVFPIRSPQ